LFLFLPSFGKENDIIPLSGYTEKVLQLMKLFFPVFRTFEKHLL